MINIAEFDTEPTTNQVHKAMCKAVGLGELSGHNEFTTCWNGIFDFNVETVDIGTTETYNVFKLMATFKGIDDGED